LNKLRENAQKHQELLRLWKLLNQDGNSTYWADYINSITHPEREHICSLLDIPYISNKKKIKPEAIQEKLTMLEVND
jgi:hypothetical protein